MALTLSTLRTEFWARGFGDLNDGGAGQTRTDRWLNDAMHVVDEIADWPYLLATATGAPALTIADLRTIECVSDIGNLNTLAPADRRTLRDRYGYVDLTTTGTATYYYFTSATTITTYPVTTNSLTVDYFKVGPDLSSGSDAPLMPDRFRYIIVDYAVAQAARDRGATQDAQAAQQAGDDRLQVMMNSLDVEQHQRSQDVVPLIGDDL